MIQEVHFRVAGAILILLAFAHAWFPRKFNWAEDAARMSLLNRQVFYVHAFFIALGVLLNGILFVAWPHLLLGGEPLAQVLLVGIGSFWFCRLVVQLFVYDSALWRGNRGRTIAHVLFTALWAGLVFLCAGALAR